MYIIKVVIIFYLSLFTFQFKLKCSNPINHTSNILNYSISPESNDSLSQPIRTVGIEAHVQLSLPTKLFCTCATSNIDYPLLSKIDNKFKYINQKPSDDDDSIYFHQYFLSNKDKFNPISLSEVIKPNEQNTIAPNKNICHICTGEPGAYGLLNPYAIPLAIIAAKIFNCQSIAKEIIFHRKTYEYFDLPKQYQLSQCRVPMASNGCLNVENYGTVGIKQIHLEEDTAKRIPQNDTQLDYNRSGVCLLEIVTDAIDATSEQIVSVCKEIQSLFRDTNLSKCKMHHGNLRFDINISCKELDNIIEVKNLNSFERIKLAIDKVLYYGNNKIPTINSDINHTDHMDDLIKYAVSHSKIIDDNKNSVTAHWNGKDNFNVVRPKCKYLYIQDWTIHPIKINDDIIASISEIINPSDYIKSLNVKIPYEKYPNVKHNLLASIYKDPIIAKFFEESAKSCDASILSNLFVNDYLRVCKLNNIKPNNTKLTSKKLSQLVNLIESNKIHVLQARTAIETLALIWEGEVADIFNLRRFNMLDIHDTKLLVDEYLNYSPARLLYLVIKKDVYIRNIIHEINRMKEGIVNPKLVFDYCNQLIKDATRNTNYDNT